MKELINFEFRKLFKSKSFFICLAVCLGLVLLGGLTTKVLLENSNGEIATPNALSMLKGVIGSANVVLISGIFTALFVCEDDTSGTIKNIYSRGYSRRDVFLSKYIVSLVSILIFTLSSMILSFLFGSVTWPSELGIQNTYVITIIAQIVMVIAYHAVFFAISSKIGKIGSSIAFNIVGPMFVSMVLGMVDAFLKLEENKISGYWIDSLLSSLQQTSVTNSVITSAIILGIVYSVIFIVIGIRINKKKEV
ncbi:MAG: ABC transporter permease [Anaeroplasma sp.]